MVVIRGSLAEQGDVAQKRQKWRSSAIGFGQPGHFHELSGGAYTKLPKKPTHLPFSHVCWPGKKRFKPISCPSCGQVQ